MQEFICFCLFPVWLFYLQSCSLLKEFSFFRQPECFFFEFFFHLCVWGRMAKKNYLIVLSFHCHGTGELYNTKEWVFSWKTSRKKDLVTVWNILSLFWEKTQTIMLSCVLVCSSRALTSQHRWHLSITFFPPGNISVFWWYIAKYFLSVKLIGLHYIMVWATDLPCSVDGVWSKKVCNYKIARVMIQYIGRERVCLMSTVPSFSNNCKMLFSSVQEFHCSIHLILHCSCGIYKDEGAKIQKNHMDRVLLDIFS